MIYGFLDDHPKLQGQQIYHIPILGKTNEVSLVGLLNAECRAFIAFEDLASYKVIWDGLTQRYMEPPLVNAIHPQAILAQHIEIGLGNAIFAGAQIGADSIIHSHCTIESNAVLGEDLLLYDHVQIGVATIIQPNVTIHKESKIEANVIIKAHVTIGEGCHITAGSIIEKDIPPHTKVTNPPIRYLVDTTH